jgi:hypothetical protein
VERSGRGRNGCRGRVHIRDRGRTCVRERVRACFRERGRDCVRAVIRTSTPAQQHSSTAAPVSNSGRIAWRRSRHPLFRGPRAGRSRFCLNCGQGSGRRGGGAACGTLGGAGKNGCRGRVHVRELVRACVRERVRACVLGRGRDCVRAVICTSTPAQQHGNTAVPVSNSGRIAWRRSRHPLFRGPRAGRSRFCLNYRRGREQRARGPGTSSPGPTSYSPATRRP